MTAKEQALSMVGQGYLYGAKGQTCSPAFRQQQAAQYPEQADNILRVGAKWDGVPVWDCAQLTRAVAAVSGVALVSGATSQWNQTDWVDRGEMDTLPDGLCFLFRAENGSNRMAHTGVALGDGTCVHAKGTAYGVVRQPMQDYPWTHWAVPRWPEKAPAAYLAFVTADKGSSVNLRKAPGETILKRLRLGSVVSVQEESGEWSHVVAEGGIEGWLLTRYLKTGSFAPCISITLETETARQLLAALQKELE